MLRFLFYFTTLIISGTRSEYAAVQGPFIMWGLDGIQTLRTSALQNIDEGNLLQVFDDAKAAIIARTDSCRQLKQAVKLRELASKEGFVSIPHHVLPLSPDLFINRTQFLELQGTDYEKDAQITEAYQQMELQYGRGNVLGILGTNCVNYEEENDEESESREKREIPEGSEGKEAPVEVWYHAPDKILLYASDYPILRYGANENGSSEEVYKLKHHVSVSSDDRGQFSRLIVTFALENGKVTVRFRFPNYNTGYWEIGSVELLDLKGSELLLSPKPMDAYLGAPVGFSFHCQESIIFTNGSVSLEIPEIQVQPQLNGVNRFSSAYDCVGFTTVPIWSGLLISWLLTAGLFTAVLMILNIKTMDRFENTKGKMLTFTVSE